MEKSLETSKIDVRIVVSGPDISEVISKAIKSIDFEKDYNIVLSSIIPTSDLSIAQKVATGGDIILIGGYGHDENFNLLFNELKTDFNHIGLFDYNNIFGESESINDDLVKEEILHSIIKSGLSYSLNLINIHTLEKKLNSLKNQYNTLSDDHNKVINENNELSKENNLLTNDLDEIKSDFSSFKDRFSDIHSKNILEVFNLEKLWDEIFNEELLNYEKVILATDKFKPDNIIIGQGFIGAKSKDLAIEWLKIIKTALIFVEDNEDELKEDISQSKPNIKEDYEIPNSFENFWD